MPAAGTLRGFAIAITVSVAALAALVPPARAADRPLYYERAIEPADLEGRSLRELALMRNTIFARAGNPFRRAWLREFFEAQPWYRPGERPRLDRLSALDRANAERIARYEVSLTRDDLMARYGRILDGSALDRDERIELDLLAERLGRTPPEQVDGDANPLQDHRLLERQLTLEQLADFSRRDLALLRNTIYARRGRPIESDLVRLHFLRFDWYRPDSAYTDRRLDRVDRRNLKLVRSLEHELGGPLGEGALEADVFA